VDEDPQPKRTEATRVIDLERVARVDRRIAPAHVLENRGVVAIAIAESAGTYRPARVVELDSRPLGRRARVGDAAAVAPPRAARNARLALGERRIDRAERRKIRTRGGSVLLESRANRRREIRIRARERLEDRDRARLIARRRLDLGAELDDRLLLDGHLLEDGSHAFEEALLDGRSIPGGLPQRPEADDAAFTVEDLSRDRQVRIRAMEAEDGTKPIAEGVDDLVRTNLASLLIRSD